MFKQSEWPRVSNGPDLNHMIMGHEGNFGIITECVLRVRKIPEVKEFSSFVFSDFEVGIKFMEEVARQRVSPASMRVVDNNQFQFAQAFKAKSESKVKDAVESLKKLYLSKVKGFDLKKICACTVVYEGSMNEVNYQKKVVNKIAESFKGLNAGSDAGMKGYFLTFIIAYIRDFAANHCYIAESFETSCPWGKVSSLISNVRERAYKACARRGVTQGIYISFRVT